LKKRLLYKKAIIVVLLLLLVPALASCDFMREEEEELEYVYLNIAQESSYGVETLEPEPGRYRYEEGAVVDIEFAEAEGWNFLGWQGDDGEDVAEENGDEYRIEMDDDKSIRADLEIEEFKGLEIDFDRIDPVDFADYAEPNEEVTDVPHNVEYISLEFNNRLHEDVVEDLEVEMKNDNSNDNDNNDNDDDEDDHIIDIDNIAVEENHLVITIMDWRDRWFYVDEDEDEYLEFGEEYSLTIEKSDEYIYDADSLKRIEPEKIEIDFVIEQPYPERPADVNVEVLNGEVEVRWLRSEKNAKVDVNEYAEYYRIYKSTEMDKLEGITDGDEIDENGVEIIDLHLDDEELQGEKVLRFEDDDVNLDEEEYYYRVSAYNEINDEIYESVLSEMVSTD